MSVFKTEAPSKAKPDDPAIEPFAKGREPVPTGDYTNSVKPARGGKK